MVDSNIIAATIALYGIIIGLLAQLYWHLKKKEEVKLEKHTLQLKEEFKKWLEVYFTINHKLDGRIENNPFIISESETLLWAEQHQNEYPFYNNWVNALKENDLLNQRLETRKKEFETYLKTEMKNEYPGIKIGEINSTPNDTPGESVYSLFELTNNIYSELHNIVNTENYYPQIQVRTEKGYRLFNDGKKDWFNKIRYNGGTVAFIILGNSELDELERWDTLIDKWINYGVKLFEIEELKKKKKEIDSYIDSYKEGIQNLINNIENGALKLKGKCDSEVHNFW